MAKKTAEKTPQVPAVAESEKKQLPASITEMPKFSVKKRVTLPTVNPAVNQPCLYRIDDAFRESTYKSPDAKKEKPATVCTVTDMATGQVMLWLVAEVAYKNIMEQYPKDTYVGKVFALQKLPKRPGKRYFDFEIAEVEIEIEE